MEQTMTHTEWAAAVAAMTEAGRKAGKAAGGWIADGHTSEEVLRSLVRMWEEGDPDAPSSPDPFSGEWSGDPTIPEVIDAETECDIDALTPEEEDELACAFEDAYHAAWQEEAERTVRAMLPD